MGENIVQFQFPFCMCISGYSGSGKSTFIQNLIQNRKKIIDSEISSILYCYRVWDERLMMLESEYGAKLHESIPSEDEIKVLSAKSLIVLDDLASKMVISKHIEQLFTEKSHHSQLGIVYATQNLYYRGICAKTINLNQHYLVLTKNPHDVMSIAITGRQLGVEKMLKEIYNDVMSKSFSYLVINCKKTNNYQTKVKHD